ncbi:MAG: transporter substrate-binding domain-containing protein [Methylophilaceae bacterium]|nr:transporter substrate-binding domain-containing protein [Methyloradius sp.]
MSAISAQKNRQVSDRIFAFSIIFLVAILIAILIIGSQYYLQRSAAFKTALSSYEIAAKDASDFISAREQHAKQVAESLAQSSDLMSGNPNSAKVTELFANAMLTNPAFYNIYLGSANGDFYEVVSLDNNPAMREYLKTEDKDHWVTAHVFDLDGKRVRQLDFLDNHLQLRATRYETSNYDARSRPWFSNAQQGMVNKTAPYIFRFPQIPGQTYSIKLNETDSVLGIDIPLEALSRHLQNQPLSQKSELYLYKSTGEIIASNRTEEKDQEDPGPIIPLTLSDRDRAYIDSLGSIKISNEQDWPPLDFAVAGKPEGYTVDLLKLAAEELGLQIEYINGYTWSQLLERFNQNKIDIIQPIAETEQTHAQGYLSKPIANLPIGMAFREGDNQVDSLEAMKGKTIAIPSGWSSIKAIQSTFPNIKILETSSSKTALEAVRDGKADATLDAAVILHYMARRYFIDGLSYVEPVDIGKADIPKNYYFLVSNRLNKLGPLLEMAIKSIDRQHRDYLRHKWLSTDETVGDKKIITVPYPELSNASSHSALLDTVQLFNSQDGDYLSYVHQLEPNNKDSDYFAVVVPATSVLGSAQETIWRSALIALGFLILLLPLTWFFSNGISKVARLILSIKR